MLQFVLTAFVALNSQLPEPPTDAQVLAALPESSGVRGDVEITKSLIKHIGPKVGGARPAANQWTCIAYYDEAVNGVTIRRVHVVYLETGTRGKWNTPVMPNLNPYRR